MQAEDMARSHAAFPEVAAISAELLRQWETGALEIALPGIRLTVVPGDARETLPNWQDKADAWFLDGFSPAKNPELWSPDLMTQVARHTAPGGSFATYTAAGAVRRALAEAGFTVTRLPGYARKRHMTAGWM